MSNIIQTYQEKIDQICQEDGIRYLALFGSQARGDARFDSDIDLLVEYSNPVGLFHHAGTQLKFEALFSKKVDLISKKYLNPLLKPYIEQDIRIIYEKKSD